MRRCRRKAGGVGGGSRSPPLTPRCPQDPWFPQLLVLQLLLASVFVYSSGAAAEPQEELERLTYPCPLTSLLPFSASFRPVSFPSLLAATSGRCRAA